MYNKDIPDSTNVQDKIKMTLDAACVPLYDWMFDTGLHQADLLVYACMFDLLRHEPLTPMYVNMSDIARKIHYSPASVRFSLDMLVEHKFLFRKGERFKLIYSLYPIE